jgi:hypothetical protein
MTKPPGVPRKKPEPRRRAIERRHSEAQGQNIPASFMSSLRAFSSLDASLDTQVPSTRNEDAEPEPVNMWPTPPESRSRCSGPTKDSTDDSGRSFFLGSTSYASVFADERPLQESVQHQEQPPERMSATPSVVANKLTGTTGTRHCQRSIGSVIISKLDNFDFFVRSVEMHFAVHHVAALVGPLITSTLPQLRQDLKQLSSVASDPYPAYAEITRNSARPLKVPGSMLASEFHTLITGQNLRWETLGLIIILAAHNTQFLLPDDVFFTLENGSKIDRDTFIEDMIHASNDCINLCQVHGAVNDIMVWLLYINMMVKSNFYGDNYHGVWRRLGETISTLYAEGIHCEESFDEPFFFRESRRRIYAVLYRSDKSLADFFGRPPMMNWRYR